jgi:hypothetical protein
MTDAPPLRAKNPSDLLALVPSLLGFHPEESVVVLTVGDALAPFHARVDLPTDPVGVEMLTSHLAEVARRHRTTRLAVLVYSDDAGMAEAVVDQLTARLSGSVAELVCAVRADGRRWWPLDGAASETPGTPYDVRSHPWMARSVVEGTVVLGSRQELADTLVGTDPEETERIAGLAAEVAARLADLDRAPLGSAARHTLVLEGHWVRHRVCRFLDDGEQLDSHDLARLTTAMAVSVEVRDVAWAEMTRDDAARHVELWRDAVRRCPVELRAAPASLLGFAAWLCGNGALAWCAVDRAQEAEPGYSLAGLLTQVLAGAMPPTAWRPFPRDALTLFAG